MHCVMGRAVRVSVGCLLAVCLWTYLGVSGRVQRATRRIVKYMAVSVDTYSMTGLYLLTALLTLLALTVGYYTWQWVRTDRECIQQRVASRGFATLAPRRFAGWPHVYFLYNPPGTRYVYLVEGYQENEQEYGVRAACGVSTARRVA